MFLLTFFPIFFGGEIWHDPVDFEVFFLEADLKKAQTIENHGHNSWNRAKPFLEEK